MPPHHVARPKGGSWLWNSGCEVIIGTTACAAPWAFGSVDAWAEFGLVICVSILAVAATVRSLRSTDPIRFLNTPGMAIAGLALLAWIQAVPLPTGVYKTLDPPGFASLNHLVPPTTPQRVRGDDDPPVGPPSLTLSQDPEATIRPAVELTAAFIFFQCAISIGGGYQTLRRFGLAITLNACALALFALIQALTWHGKIYGIRPSPIPEAWYSGGPFVSYHHLAAYLNFGLGFALAFALGAGFTGGLSRSGKKIPGFGGQRISPLALYATGLIAVGVIGSHSRGGFLAMAASGAVLLLVLRRQPPRVWIGMAVVFLFMGLFLFAIGSASPLERLTTILSASESGFNGRSQIWISSLRTWLANPVWGVGLGCFSVGAAPFYDFARESLYFHAENDYLEVLAEGGLLGFGLGILAFAAIARLCARAYGSAVVSADRTIVVGGLFGLVALAVKSCADFPLHIAGVAVTGLVLCAYLSRIGLDANRTASDATTATNATRWQAPLALSILAALCIPLLWLSYGLARDEIALMRAGVPLPGTQWLTADYGRMPIEQLEETETTLEKILADRPDWSEGYLRLGMTYLSHYDLVTTELSLRLGQSADEAIVIADPLWLHRVVHTEIKSESELEKFIEDDPIWLYLIPAARNFLQARRCCRVRALPHAWLASLDFLVLGGETTAVHAERALDQSGNDTRIMAVAARAALDVGDLSLAARCWRKSLQTFPSRVDEIARVAGGFLTPRQILDEVLSTNATQIIQFADLLYAKPESKSARDLFLAEAIKRADVDSAQTPTERLWVKAQAQARRDERAQARKLMESALADEPDRESWRGEYVDWLILWGDPDEAFRQAQIGVYLHPEGSGPKAVLERATQARSRKLLEPASPP